MLKGRHNSLVVCYTSLEKDLVPDPPVAYYLFEIIIHYRIGKASYHIVISGTLLYAGIKVRFHENSTPVTQFYGVFGFQRHRPEFLDDLYVQLLSLLLKKRSGAGSAHLVHLKVDHNSVLNTDKL